MNIFSLTLLLAVNAAVFQLLHLDADMSHCCKVDIRELTIQAAHKLLMNGTLSSASLTKCYIRRIRAMNPQLRAVIEINPDALTIAQGLDDYFKVHRRLAGTLHGVPILVKDNIATGDNMNTTAGSWALLGAKPKDDAKVIKQLRKAGAINLGKANLSELSGYLRLNQLTFSFLSFKAQPGWSSRGGQTKNPYRLRQTPGGSSSGSAVAVAANLALVALGTDTDGSVINPAAAASTVGFRPSIGKISNKGIIPLSQNQDSVNSPSYA
ncbi:hypothetical protein DSO57_1039338 [Entomophthora muscae]|uniref:Uncharacterized protein n=1 Tax=Entomophthora muscae TaxID=34485 RepID=A0ACC2UID5_9FUNG|nr:hypothetical protein DSO57_1039338 [Entomophthora muscae]